MSKEKLYTYLLKYLVFVLDELTETIGPEDFIVGEITAYTECLEILSFGDKFNVHGTADFVKKYQIK